MNSDSGAIYSCRLSSPPSVPPDFFFSFFLWAGGTGGRLKGICDLIITPSPHLSDPAASISLSAPLSLALSHRVTPLLSLPLALYCSLSPSIFHPISVSSVSLCIPSLTPTLCRLWPPLCVGGRRIGDSVLPGEEAERRPQSENKPSKMRTSLILPQINRLGEMMPVREWIRICSRYCDPLGVCTDYVRMHRHIPRGEKHFDWIQGCVVVLTWNTTQIWRKHGFLFFGQYFLWTKVCIVCVHAFVISMKPKMYAVLTVMSHNHGTQPLWPNSKTVQSWVCSITLYCCCIIL